MDFEVGQIVFPISSLGWEYGIIGKVESNKYYVLKDGSETGHWMNKVLLHFQAKLDTKRSRDIKIGNLLKKDVQTRQ